MTESDKIQQLSSLYAEYQSVYADTKCVFGSGNINCKVMLIGEAPGKDEIAQQKPFVGSAGKILTSFLDSILLDRSDLFITNTIKYRLSKPGKKPNTLINRPAKQLEIDENAKYLIREISIIKPLLIVTLGNIPLSSLIGKKFKIGYCHGQRRHVIINDALEIIYPLYHPASIIYNRSLEELYVKDIQNLKTIVRIL